MKKRWSPGCHRPGFIGAFLGAFLAAPFARADVSEPAPRPDEQFDIMNLLTEHGLHDQKEERWNAYGQFTFIGSYKPPFAAKYGNLNGENTSLSPNAEGGWTGSFTLYLGAKLWRGGEAYYVPEVISERALSNLRGLGGAIQDFELQKQGSETPQIYRSRAYLQQTINFGGVPVEKNSDPQQLGTTVDSRRLVLRLGNFSVIDFMDTNTFSGDLHQTFFNMDFLTYAAFDFVADARGYSWGGLVEAYYDDWALRFGRLAPPLMPNGAAVTFELDKFYGDQVEVEHDYRLFGRAGAARLIGYRNVENMARFDDAIAMFKANPTMNNATQCGDYLSTNANAPGLCYARKPNVKMGIGISFEQYITGDLGVFFRGMYSDGNTEVYSFTSTDRSISLGSVTKGSVWHRPKDVTGIGVGLGWISQSHAEYLRLGGIDGFIGDGNIRSAPESVFELFYSVNVLNPVWISGDYQHILNPAFNADRGPVDVFGARVHAEF